MTRNLDPTAGTAGRQLPPQDAENLPGSGNEIRRATPIPDGGPVPIPPRPDEVTPGSGSTG
jgi:hypothetical protein